MLEDVLFFLAILSVTFMLFSVTVSVVQKFQTRRNEQLSVA
jgi:hypothetical protein